MIDLEVANVFNRKIARKRKRPPATGEMGGETGKVFERQAIKGLPSTVQLRPGVEVKVHPWARIVTTEAGETEVVSGGSESPVSAREARKIAPDSARMISNALKRARRRIASHLRGK